MVRSLAFSKCVQPLQRVVFSKCFNGVRTAAAYGKLSNKTGLSLTRLASNSFIYSLDKWQNARFIKSKQFENILSLPREGPRLVRQFTTWNKMIVYSRISPSDCSDVAEHLLKNFFLHEPFGLALGLTVDQVKPWFPKFLDEVLNYYEPVSFMAKDTDTNEIVGVAINLIIDPADESRKPPPGMKPYLDRSKQPVKWQIATFLEDLEEGVDVVKCLNMDPNKPNKIFACLFLSVDQSYAGKGLSKTLIRESEQEARNIDGVTIAMTDTTSHYSYLAFKRLGYEVCKEVEYMSYKDPEGVAIFEGRAEKLGVHTHAKVVAKPI